MHHLCVAAGPVPSTPGQSEASTIIAQQSQPIRVIVGNPPYKSGQGSANDNKKIYKNNYEAVKQAIKNAMKKGPTIDEIIAKKDTKHPFE